VKTLKLIGWIIIGLALVVFGIWLLWLLIAYRNLFNLFVGLPSLLVGLWILLSIKIIGPTEMAVYIWLGEAIGFRDSGACFVHFLFARLVKFPKKMFTFTYENREVITKPGDFVYVPEEEKKAAAEKEYYGRQTVKVDFEVYLNLPREKKRLKEEVMTMEELREELKKRQEKDRKITIEGLKKEEEETHPLIKILRADIPLDEEGLKNWVGGVVIAAARIALSKITWGEGLVSLKELTREIEGILMDPTSPFIKVGFSKEGFRLVITKLDPPTAVKESFAGVDIRKYEARAARFEAERTTGKMIGMEAGFRGKKPEEIQAEIDQQPERWKELQEFSKDFIIREMGANKGAYLDIRTPDSKEWGGIFTAETLWKRMPVGSGTSESEEKKEREEKREQGEKKPDWPALEEERRKSEEKLEKKKKKK